MNDKEMRELDAWIAEHVMRLNQVQSVHALNHKDDFCVSGCEQSCWVIDCGPNIKKFSPTTDPAAAMLVLEKCAEECKRGKFNDSVDVGKTKSGFEVGRIELEYDWSIRHQSKAATLPIAICLFAKKLFKK